MPLGQCLSGWFGARQGVHVTAFTVYVEKQKKYVPCGDLCRPACPPRQPRTRAAAPVPEGENQILLHLS